MKKLIIFVIGFLLFFASPGNAQSLRTLFYSDSTIVDTIGTGTINVADSLTLIFDTHVLYTTANDSSDIHVYLYVDTVGGACASVPDTTKMYVEYFLNKSGSTLQNRVRASAVQEKTSGHKIWTAYEFTLAPAQYARIVFRPEYAGDGLTLGQSIVLKYYVIAWYRY